MGRKTVFWLGASVFFCLAATHDAGGLPQGSSYFLGQPRLRPRDPKGADGAAQQRRCPVKYTPRVVLLPSLQYTPLSSLQLFCRKE